MPDRPNLRVLAATALVVLLATSGWVGAPGARADGEGSNPAPATTVSLTFDDGTADELQAVETMNQHSMAGTFFVITGRIGAPGYLSLTDLNALAAVGHEIGDHTVSHLNLLTISPEEAERQVCNARVQLMSWGFHVWDMAYPQGGTNAELEQIVRNCNLNSARVASNLVSPGTCFGCPFAETLPPRDPYAIATPDSIKSTNTLEDLKTYVTQAQEHGGGWVPLVFHHICDGCNVDAVSPAIFAAFLDWLETQRGNGVTIRTVHEVVGGEELPAVSGPAPSPPLGELVRNPSVELDQDGNGVPDCWTVGGSGTNAWTAGLTPDDNSGNFAEHISISSFTSGDRRLVTSQDLGACAPPVTVGDTYTASAYLKGQGTMRWVAYYREGQGGWIYWAQSAAISTGSSFAQKSWTTPAIPTGATALSFGISLRSIGTFTADDFYLSDNGPADQTAPVVSVTAPEAGATVNGPLAYISANATDNVGVISVKFALDGALLGSKTAPTVPGGSTYQWKWDATAAGPGQHTLSSIATDAAGNQTSSAPVTVTVAQADTQGPTTQLTAPTIGSTVSGTAVYIVAQATDNVSVSSVRFLLDGVSLGSKTAPTVAGGSTYQWKWDATWAIKGAHLLTVIATDAAGNQTTSAPVTVTVA